VIGRVLALKLRMQRQRFLIVRNCFLALIFTR
jgi:hypothetical protein